MIWRVQRLDRDLGAFAAQWDALNARLTGGNPMLDSAFVTQLLARFGDGKEWLCWRERSERDGQAAAMCLLTRHRPGVWRSFLPAQAQLGPTLIGDPDDLHGLSAALPGTVLLVDLLCNDPRHGRLHLPGALPATWQRHAITMAIPLTGSFEDYWQQRPKKLRDNMRRYERRATMAHGKLELSMLTEPDAVRLAVARYAELEAKGWKAKLGTDLAALPQQLAFYGSVMAHHAALGQAAVVELHHDGQLAASRLVIVQGGLVIALKSTFDESKREWAPGRIMLTRFIKAAFEQWPGQQLDFYTNASSDQLEWAGSQRSIHDLSLYRGKFSASIGRLWYKLRSAHGWPVLGALPQLDDRESVQVHHGMSTLPPSARALLAQAERDNVEWGAGWLDVHARTVARASPGVRFLSLHRGPLAVAAMALNVDPSLGELGCRVGALTSFYSSSWSPALTEHATIFALIPLLAQLRVESRGAPRLWFSPMAPDSDSFSLLRGALRRTRYAVFCEFAHGNWFHTVEGDYAQYLASRSRSTRSILKQAQKKVVTAGVRLEILSEPADLQRAVRAYSHVYAHSWKRSEPVADFIGETAALCADRGWLRMGLAWLADEPIAVQLWIVSGGRAAILKMAYHEGHKHFGAGNALTALLMQHCIDIDKVKEVDYLVGDDPYKQQWMTHRREMKTLVACDLMRPMGLLWTLRYGLAQIDWLRRLWTRAKAWRLPITGALGRFGPSVSPPINSGHSESSH